MTTETQVSVAGGQLHLTDSGEPDLVPIVCLHSLFLDNRQFDEFAEAAAGRYRVVRADFRGQGASSPATGDIVTVESCAGDTQALLDKIGISNAHFLVSSMGGDVGLRLAANRPDLIRSLVLTGTSARSEPTDQLADFEQLVAVVRQDGFTEQLMPTFMRIMFGETTLQDPAKAQIVELWRGRIAALPPELASAILGVIRRTSVVPLLPYITAPSLVVSGEECIARPPEWAKELADGLPNAELWMLPKTGHSPLLEAASEVNTRILGFFDAH